MSKAHRQVFGETIERLGHTIPELVVLDADLAKSTKTATFAKSFPKRFFDMGISEQDMIATSAGLAVSGMIPVASTFAIFGSGRAWEQLRNSVCYPKLNVKVITTHGGITVGEDGGSHQSVEDLAITRVIPNLNVIVPADDIETEKAVEYAITHDGPFYIRLPRGSGERVHSEDYQFQLGKANHLREGNDIALIACGLLVDVALKAAEQLAQDGIKARVINAASLKPFDQETIINAAKDCGAILTMEEHSIIGGLGGAVCESLSEHHPVPVKRMGINDTFGQSGSANDLMKHYQLTPEHAVELAKDVLAKKS